MVRPARLLIRTAAAAVALATAAVLSSIASAPAWAVNAPQSVIVSPDPVDWTPNVLDGQVHALAQIGSTMFVGGTFTQVEAAGSATALTRHYLFAFDVHTGAIDSIFTPQLDGTVEAIAAGPDGHSIFVGGLFANANGAAVNRLTKLDTATGQTIAAFKAPAVGSGVYDLAVSGSRVYVGGSFTKIRNTPRSRFAAVDVTTGLVDPSVDVAFTGKHNGGTTRVSKLDITPDGSKLVATGNFTQADGMDRNQIAILDLTTTPVAVESWETDAFKPACASRFDTYMRDLDISPDGAYFALVTTGAYFGGSGAGVLCDTTSRWELSATGSGLKPTWVEYTGGDTQFSVAVTGTAIYTGGHQRWENNPFAGDRVGPGAVQRTGLAALDPVNGMPFSWNPTRIRGRGVFALLATPDGLWEGSDTDFVAHEYHARLGMFPVAGGETVPTAVAGSLPGALYTTPNSQCPAADASILYRVNAGGPTLPATDCGPAWTADTSSTSPYRNAGSSAASWSSVATANASVPSTTPAQVFSTERWDGSSSPEMQWGFSVPAGTHVQVRLYFANQCSCTNLPGRRVFNVSIDGSTLLSRYDIVADVGNQVGTMKSFNVTSDGSVDVAFGHVTENPLINAVEIINRDVAPGPGPTPAEYVVRRSFDGATAGLPATLNTPGVDWTHTRGAFMLSGRLYTGSDSGTFSVRSFDGSTFGSPTALSLNGLTASYFPIASVTGMFYDGGRLFYTVTGDPRMYYRYFEPEDGVVGAQTFVASGSGDGLDWHDVKGMTLADGRIYFARANNDLYSIGFSGGVPVPGTTTLVSGPDTGDGQTWISGGMFVFAP